MIKNEYKIIDGYAILYVTRRNGDVFEIYIDIEDLKLLDKLNCKIYVKYTKNNDSYYAGFTVQRIGKNNNPKTFLLHRVVLGIDDRNVAVNHINFNTLDDRKHNLNPDSFAKNSQYRKSKNKNNNSGYRNVSWNSDKNKWVVQLQIDGKNHMFKETFDDVEEANLFAIAMREKYYGEICIK